MTNLELRTFKHTILQGPDEERLRELQFKAAALEPKGPRGEASGDLLSDDDPWAAFDAAVAEANAFGGEAMERGMTVILRPLGHKKWRDLVKEFPPGDDKVAKSLGVDWEPFTEALILACLSSPILDDPQAFLDELPTGHYHALSDGAWDLNKKLGADPKALTRFARTRS